MDSFEEFLREVTPHNIQHQVSILKKQAVLWSEDTLVQIVNCIFEKVSAEPPDLIYLYVYSCKMMLEKSKAGKEAGNGLGVVCSFLSQLFVQDVLSSDTLLSCINSLMVHNTEVTWQCLSKILKNSFVHLESLGTLHLFKCVFQKIYEKIQKKHFSVQTRFMLCDLNDLEHKHVKQKNRETVEAQFHTFDKIRRDANIKDEIGHHTEHKSFGIPSAEMPRGTPMQPVSASTFAPRPTMKQPAMFTPRTSNQNPQAAPPFSFPYFPATQSVQQNQERKKKILRIQDPTSGEDLTESILRDGVVIPASSQVAGAGPSSSPPQHKEPESQVQESRRIQAEFLTNVSQVASNPGSRKFSIEGPTRRWCTAKRAVIGTDRNMTRKDVTCSAGLENGISRTSSSTETSKARKGATRSENQEKLSKSQSHTNSKQMKLKYPYKEGQWSPINQAGKKRYDRVFLLSVQPDCTIRPKGLPDIPEVILPKAEVRFHHRKPVTSKSVDNLSTLTDRKTDSTVNTQKVIKDNWDRKKSDQVSKLKGKSSEKIAAVEFTAEQYCEPQTISKQLKLKYSYREDQWSPTNQDGQKKYSRDFLLTIRPECIVRPEGLPDMPEIIFKKAKVWPILQYESCALKVTNIEEQPRNSMSGRAIKKNESSTVGVAPSTVTEPKTTGKNGVKKNLVSAEDLEKLSGARSKNRIQNGRRETKKELQFMLEEINVYTATEQDQLSLARGQRNLTHQLGKRKYSRDFLLGFQGDCTCKPDGMPDVVIEKDQVKVVFPKDDLLSEQKRIQTNGLKKGRLLSEEIQEDRSRLSSRRKNQGKHEGTEGNRRENGENKLTFGGIGLQQYQSILEGVTAGAGTRPREDQQPQIEDVSESVETQEEVAPSSVEPSEDAYRETFEGIIIEYLTLRNVQKACSSLSDLPTSSFHHLFVSLSLEMVLDKHSGLRDSIGRLFHSLLDSEIVSKEQFSIGFELFLESTTEVAWSNSSFWKNLAEILAVMVTAGTENLEFMTEIIQTLPGDGSPVCLMIETLKQILKSGNVYQVLRFWRNSKFNWSQFAPDDLDIKKILEKEKLVFILPPEKKVKKTPKVKKDPVPTEIPQRQMKHKRIEKSISSFQNGLLNLLQRQPTQHRKAFDFIENSIKEEMKSTKEFIQALVLAVLMSTAVEGDVGPYTKCQRELLKRRSALLRAFVRKDEALQMQAVQVAQAFSASVGNPPKFLRTMFEVFYDEDVVSEEIFYTWLDSEETCATSSWFRNLTVVADSIDPFKTAAIPVSVVEQSLEPWIWCFWVVNRN
ncbi:eukaryotic initiation factor 4G [Apostichopus japonicus]|uniref:Eukaryotic initiation factor 4G n=1 Tax=Stichopus japonicus TaxID=307972 RepID=A0A2G8L2W3_STIJA|nr:eukaryotic initiation factor 4G [Apostichopus japonicus]